MSAASSCASCPRAAAQSGFARHVEGVEGDSSVGFVAMARKWSKYSVKLGAPVGGGDERVGGELREVDALVVEQPGLQPSIGHDQLVGGREVGPLQVRRHELHSTTTGPVCLGLAEDGLRIRPVAGEQDAPPDGWPGRCPGLDPPPTTPSSVADPGTDTVERLDGSLRLGAVARTDRLEAGDAGQDHGAAVLADVGEQADEVADGGDSVGVVATSVNVDRASAWCRGRQAVADAGVLDRQ